MNSTCIGFIVGYPGTKGSTPHTGSILLYIYSYVYVHDGLDLHSNASAIRQQSCLPAWHCCCRASQLTGRGIIDACLPACAWIVRSHVRGTGFVLGAREIFELLWRPVPPSTRLPCYSHDFHDMPPNNFCYGVCLAWQDDKLI